MRTEELAVRKVDLGLVPSAPEPQAEPRRAAVVESMREATREPEPPAFKPSGVQPVGGIPAAPPPALPSLPVDTVNAAALPIANTTPAPPPVDERARVRSVLGRYEAAYTNLDAGAAQSVWPAVDAGALARAFGSLESQRVSLGRCDVSVSGATARANCSGSASWRPKVGTGRTQPRRWDFTLQNAAGNWQIVSVQAR